MRPNDKLKICQSIRWILRVFDSLGNTHYPNTKRYIVNSSTCSTTELSTPVTNIVSAVKRYNFIALRYALTYCIEKETKGKTGTAPFRCLDFCHLPQIWLELSSFYQTLWRKRRLASNIATTPSHGVYISQLVYYSRACSLYSVYLRSHRLLNTKQVTQESFFPEDINILLNNNLLFA